MTSSLDQQNLKVREKQTLLDLTNMKGVQLKMTESVKSVNLNLPNACDLLIQFLMLR